MRDILGYTFATIAGVCFAGLAVTVMSIKEDDDE